MLGLMVSHMIDVNVGIIIYLVIIGMLTIIIFATHASRSTSTLLRPLLASRHP